MSFEEVKQIRKQERRRLEKIRRGNIQYPSINKENSKLLKLAQANLTEKEFIEQAIILLKDWKNSNEFKFFSPKNLPENVFWGIYNEIFSNFEAMNFRKFAKIPFKEFNLEDFLKIKENLYKILPSNINPYIHAKNFTKEQYFLFMKDQMDKSHLEYKKWENDMGYLRTIQQVPFTGIEPNHLNPENYEELLIKEIKFRINLLNEKNKGFMLYSRGLDEKDLKPIPSSHLSNLLYLVNPEYLPKNSNIYSLLCQTIIHKDLSFLLQDDKFKNDFKSVDTEILQKNFANIQNYSYTFDDWEAIHLKFGENKKIILFADILKQVKPKFLDKNVWNSLNNKNISTKKEYIMSFDKEKQIVIDKFKLKLQQNENIFDAIEDLTINLLPFTKENKNSIILKCIEECENFENKTINFYKQEINTLSAKGEYLQISKIIDKILDREEAEMWASGNMHTSFDKRVESLVGEITETDDFYKWDKKREKYHEQINKIYSNIVTNFFQNKDRKNIFFEIIESIKNDPTTHKIIMEKIGDNVGLNYFHEYFTKIKALNFMKIQIQKNPTNIVYAKNLIKDTIEEFQREKEYTSSNYLLREKEYNQMKYFFNDLLKNMSEEKISLLTETIQKMDNSLLENLPEEIQQKFNQNIVEKKEYSFKEIKENPELFKEIDGSIFPPEKYMQLAQIAVKKDWQNYKYIQVENLPQMYGNQFYGEVINYIKDKIDKDNEPLCVEFLQNIQPQYLKDYTDIIENILQIIKYEELPSGAVIKIRTPYIETLFKEVNNEFFLSYDNVAKKAALKVGISILDSITFPIDPEKYTDICKYIVSNDKIYDFLNENVVLDKINPQFLNKEDYLEICKIAISKNAENIEYAQKEFLPENINISLSQSKSLGIN